MQSRLRAASVAAIVAMAGSLALAPAALTTATASPVAPERPGISAECASAQAALASARTSKAKAHKKVAKARKKLRKAKHTHRHARIHKAKKVLKRWRHRYAARSHNVELQTARVGYACSSPTSTARATGTGQKMDLLVTATGTLTQLIDATQLAALLDRLLPGVGSSLSPTQLTSLLGGFNTGALSLDDATILLGSVFSPAELQSLLGGSASPELVLALAENIISELSGLGGGFPVPGSFDPTDLLQTIAGMFGSLDPSQLGGLLNLLLVAAGQGGTSLSPTQLTDLLDALIPGLSSQFDASQLTSMLTAVNGSSLDATTLSNLLGGQFSSAQLQQVLASTSSSDLTGGVLANILAQLATAGGGGLVLPGALDSSAALGLVTDVTGLVSDLLNSTLGGGGGGLVCTLLPILC